jgi:hypothetical protein
MTRVVLLLLAAVLAGVPSWLRRGSITPVGYEWFALAAALLLAVAGSWGVSLPGTALHGPSGPATKGRRAVGAVLLLAGVALWFSAPLVLLQSWNDYFDLGWSAWLGGTVLIAVGLDLVWARWQRPTPRQHGWWAALVVLLAVAALYRFGTFYLFPGESHITQIEELQVGGMGTAYLMGWRQRWEYLSHAWLAALGIWLGGPSLMAMRAPFVCISILKAVPLFLWLRYAAGNTAAIVGTLLMAFSAWDVTYARSPTNQNTLIVAASFALLAGPARRGRPSAYAWLGLLGGYVFFEYVAYRLVGLFALTGSLLATLRTDSPWWAKLARPAVTAALIATMATTLYLHLDRTGQMYQFFDGWGRARANTSYYRAEDSLAERGRHIGERSLQTVGLFYFHGDESPVRNLRAEPMIDPVTAALLLLGVAYGLANPLRNTSGLAVAALAMTLGGTMIATGNFDPIRAGGTVPYVYGLAGWGAACLLEVMSTALGRWGRRVGIAFLGVALLLAFVDNTRFLKIFLESTLIRDNQFRDLAYLSGWVGRNVRPGERVLAIAPGNSFLFEGNDAAWMRGVQTEGAAVWDITTALERLRSKRPTLFMVYAGASTREVGQYLAWLLPSLPLEIVSGPKGPESDIAYVHLAAPPEDLPRRLEATAACPGATAVFRILGNDEAELTHEERVVPFVDRSTFPHSVLSDVWRLQDETKSIRVQFNASFGVRQGGDYFIIADLAPGDGDLFVDGEHVETLTGVRLALQPGMHTLELRGVYPAKVGLPSAELFWAGPDTGEQKQLMPLYRLGENEACRASTASEAIARGSH